MAGAFALNRPMSVPTGFARSRGEAAQPRLWDGLLGAWVAAADIRLAYANLVDGDAVTPGSEKLATDRIVYKGVICSYHDKHFNDGLVVTNKWGINPQDNEPYTVVQRLNIVTSDRLNATFSQADGSGNGRQWLGVDDTPGQTFTSYMGGSETDGPFDYTLNEWHSAAMTWTGGAGGTVQVWSGGVAGTARTETGENGNGDFKIGAHKTSSGFSPRCRVGETYLWNRILDPQEIRAIHRDPYAPVRWRRRKTIYVEAAAPAQTFPGALGLHRINDGAVVGLQPIEAGAL